MKKRGCGAVDWGMRSGWGGGGWGPVIGIYGYLSLARPIYQGRLRGRAAEEGPRSVMRTGSLWENTKTKEGRIWLRSESDIGWTAAAVQKAALGTKGR